MGNMVSAADKNSSKTMEESKTAFENVAIKKKVLFEEYLELSSKPTLDAQIEEVTNRHNAKFLEFENMIKKQRKAYDDLTQLKADASLSDSGDEDNLKDKRKSEDNKNANKWSAALKKKLDELAKTDGQCTERKVELVKKLKSCFAEECAFVKKCGDGLELAVVDLSQHNAEINAIKAENNGHLSTIEDLKKQISELNRQLKSYAFKYCSPITSDKAKARIAELAKENSDLKKAKDALTKSQHNKISKSGKVISDLREELAWMKPLFDVGVAVRLAVYPKYMLMYGGAEDLLTDEEHKLIQNKNDAAHRGNYRADFSLFHFKFLKEKYQPRFKHLYGTGPGLVSAKAIEIVNMYGSQILCGLGTKYSHSTDKEFENQFKNVMELHERTKAENKDDTAMMKFDDSLTVLRYHRAMKIDTDKVIKKEQKRLAI